MILRWYYRWRHHRRRHKRRQRFRSGVQPPEVFARFGRHVFGRARVDRYDRPWRIAGRWLVGGPLALFALWFLVESIRAVGIFQP